MTTYGGLEMNNLFRKSMTKKEIADNLNLSYGTVFKYLKKENLGPMEKLKKWMVFE